MSLTPQQMDRTMDEHFAFEARDDIDGVLATLTDDVEHDIVGWPFGPSHDRAHANSTRPCSSILPTARCAA